MTARWARLQRPALAAAAAAVLLVLGLGAWRAATSPARRFTLARRALAEDRYDRAEELAALLERAGEADRAHLIRAESCRRLAQDEPASPRGQRLLVQALTHLDAVRDQGALRVPVAVLAGQCYLDLRDLSEAARAFTYALEQDPTRVDAHRGLAAVYYDLGSLRRAAHHLDEVARLDPTDGRPYRLLGLIHKDLDEQEPAVAAYRAALARTLAPATVQDVRLEMAEVLVRQSHFAEALEALAGLDEERAAGDRVRTARVEALWGLGNAAAAEEAFRAALAAGATGAPFLAAGAKVLAGTGRPGEAVPLLEKAVAAAPHDYPIRYQLAAAYTAVSRPDAAAAQREQADRLAKVFDELTQLNREANERPWDAGLRQRMAELCDSVGRAGDAAMWRQAARACPPPAGAPGSVN